MAYACMYMQKYNVNATNKQQQQSVETETGFLVFYVSHTNERP